MYAEITSVNYDAKTSTVELEATDLDSILLNDWADELQASKPITFRFDLSQRGPRIYLYKICKGNVKEACKSMVDQVMALNGQIINISSNFIAEAEG
ncbi:MAG: hypothetical protein K6E34_13655 [Lachnospiraceae bacterium]|nr:hypothetical protein [Lachnospiraceae bacterium]